ncbi:MAG: hypothetical protein AAFV95_24315 [Bacteroidota bacterium]
MNIQPSSKAIRKFIPIAAYFDLCAQQRNRSFIGCSLRNCSQDTIDKRIKELEALEERGFVYLGEKNWLVSFQRSNRPHTLAQYDAWVKNNFDSHLGLTFELTTEEWQGLNIWSADLLLAPYSLAFDALKHPSYRLPETLEIFVLGNESRPASSHLLPAFEFLHNLEYSVSTFP